MSFYRLGLIGYPLDHSLSPVIHQQSLMLTDLEGEYVLYPIVPTENANENLNELIIRIKNNDLVGINVTIPYKQTIIKYLDELTSTASSVGAVNLVYLENSKIIGDNTDSIGFWLDLCDFLGDDYSASCQKAIVLGSGGSACAVVFELICHGWDVVIVTRNIEKTNNIFQQMTCKLSLIHLNSTKSTYNHLWDKRIKIISYGELELLKSKIDDYNLIVNATPVGMAPDINNSPWPNQLPLPINSYLYDLIYNPLLTRFIQQGIEQGLKVRNGIGMLLNQAVLSFNKWTGSSLSSKMIDKRSIMECLQ